MADEPEEGFVIRDRRRFTSELSEEQPTAVTSSPVASPPSSPVENLPIAEPEPLDFVEEGEEDREDGGEEDNSLPDIYSVLILFLGEMRNHALLRMGLVPNPMTGQSERDLEQARVAINTAGFLAEQLEPVLPPEERLPLKAMLSDLQMHFVEQARRG
jgi:hypothetical protein